LRIRKTWQAFRNQSPLQLFTWLTILIIFIFYCIPKSKRSVYLLPIYPFMALLIAEYLLARVRQGARMFKVCAVIFASLGLLLTVVFAAVRADLIPESIWGTGRHAAENIAFMHALRDVSLSVPQWLLVALPVVAAVCALWLVARRAGSYALLYGVAGCMLCLFVSLDGVYQPTVLAVKSDKALAERLDALIPEGLIYSCSHINFYGVNYYLGDRMRYLSKAVPEVSEGYALVAEPQKEEALGLLEEHQYRVEEVFYTDKRSCDTRSKVILFRFSKKK